MWRYLALLLLAVPAAALASYYVGVVTGAWGRKKEKETPKPGSIEALLEENKKLDEIIFANAPKGDYRNYRGGRVRVRGKESQ